MKIRIASCVKVELVHNLACIFWTHYVLRNDFPQFQQRANERRRTDYQKRRKEKNFYHLNFILTFIMPHLYCVECKAKLDNIRHHAINNPLLKLYLCARMEISLEVSDRLCTKCRSAFDYWRRKFAKITDIFTSMSNDNREASIWRKNFIVKVITL